MFRAVVEQMTPLAECFQVAMAPPATRGVMIEVSRRQHDTDRSEHLTLGQGRAGGLAATAVAPDAMRLVPPTAVAQVPHRLAMWAAAELAAALGAHEPHPSG